MTTEITIAGFGGQGVLFAGKTLAYAGMDEDLQISWLPSYGPEMRGGTANCTVIISDEPIGSPIISKCDVLFAMNKPSLDKFVNTVRPGGVIIIDSVFCDTKVERDDVTVVYIPAKKIAEDAGNATLGNMVMIGAFLKKKPVFTMEEIANSVRAHIPPSKAALADVNINMIQSGYDFE